MTVLIAGLLLFLGVHSIRIVADPWRQQQLMRWGENTWKGIYSLISIAGLALIVIGYSAARLQPVVLWYPPAGMRHLAALLTLIAFILIAAAYVPRNIIKARLVHPMILGIKVWALAHLFANGTLADVILFGAFLVWAIVDFRSARRRQAVAANAANPTVVATVATLVIGVAVWAIFAFYLHEFLMGVRPFA
ncbi:MAG: NnrU family protein [Spongiibacteraceae bacterium]